MKIVYNDDSLLDEEHKSTPLELIERLKLQEEECPKDWRITYFNNDDRLILERLRELYGDKGYYPISWQELRRVIWSIYKGMYDIKLHSADLVRIARTYWKGGEFRRFFISQIHKKQLSKKTGRAHAYGIHYIIYPKHKSLDNVKLMVVDWELSESNMYIYNKRYRERLKKEGK